MTSIIQPVPKLPEELSRKLKKFQEVYTRAERKEDLAPVTGIEEVLDYIMRPYSTIYLHPPFRSASEKLFVPAKNLNDGSTTLEAYTYVSEPNKLDGTFSMGLSAGNFYKYVSDTEYSFAPLFYYNQLSSSMIARHTFPDPLATEKILKITVDVSFPDILINKVSYVQRRNDPDSPLRKLTFAWGRFGIACKSFENDVLITKRNSAEFLWNGDSSSSDFYKTHLSLSIYIFVKAGTSFIDIELNPELFAGCSQNFVYPYTGTETHFEFGCADFRNTNDEHYMFNGSGLGLDDFEIKSAGNIKIDHIKVEFFHPVQFNPPNHI